jgi:hypothetical protein
LEQVNILFTKLIINTKKINHLTDDWTNIPFYPNANKKQELVKQYGVKDAEEIIKYSYENSTDPTKEVVPPRIQLRPETHRSTSNTFSPQITGAIQLSKNSSLYEIQKYNEEMRRNNSTHRIIPPNVSPFSPDYTKIIASKQKAASSAYIRLGGIYS